MPRSILIAVDLSDQQSLKQLIVTGESLAKLDGAAIHVLTVVPSFSMPIVASYFPADFAEKAIEEAKQHLAEAIAGAAANPDAISGHVAHGTVYHEVLHCADKLDCDLIVMKSHRPELRDYLLGPNTARVVRHAKQSVYVLRD